MKKSAKVGNACFLHLSDQTLYLDDSKGTSPLNLSEDISNQVLDFSFDEEGIIRIFTIDGRAIKTSLSNLKKTKVNKFSGPFLSASICKDKILACHQSEVGQLFDFNGNFIRDYKDIPKGKKVRFCLLTNQIKVLADSSTIFVYKSDSDVPDKYKLREYFLTNLIDINRQTEFGFMTTKNTRIFHKHYHTVFRGWAQNTVALLQCPCTKHFFAHVDTSGLLRIGDNEADYSFQKIGVTGICWDMGILWARDEKSVWSKIIMAYSDQIFDLRCVTLEGLEAPFHLETSGKVFPVLETLRERPALSKEVLETKLLAPIAQNLTAGMIVQEVKHSLDAYIKKSEDVNNLIGQIDLALAVANKE